ALLPLYATFISAVKLNDFVPRLDDLPADCDEVYNEQIAGCGSSDFGPGSECSTQCVAGLISIREDVQRNCGNANVPHSSLLGFFLLGAGIQKLCPNVRVETQSRAQSTPTGGADSSTTPASEVPASSQAPSSSSSSEPVSSEAETTSSPERTQTQGGIVVDASTPAGFTEAPARPTQTGLSNGNTDGSSGGGSPFDISGSSSLESARLTLICSSLLFVLGAFAAL
ncbi:hypothetical protein M501DRAFT_962497, partial [Patellaria atrata CBS 101060]